MNPGFVLTNLGSKYQKFILHIGKLVPI